jgi:hypothetical protein
VRPRPRAAPVTRTTLLSRENSGRPVVAGILNVTRCVASRNEALNYVYKLLQTRKSTDVNSKTNRNNDSKAARAELAI